MLMLEPASILTLESFRRLPPIVHKGNPGVKVLQIFKLGALLHAEARYHRDSLVPFAQCGQLPPIPA